MVVVHTQPSTSTSTVKKNRRKLHKKRTGDRDAEMHDGDAPSSGAPADEGSEDEDIMIDGEDAAVVAGSSAPAFAPLSAAAQRTALKSETRRVPIPPHRMTPLKKEWVNIFGPLTEILGLQVRMNVHRRCVEIRVCPIGPPRVRKFTNERLDVQTHEGSRRTAEGRRLCEIVCSGI